MLRFCPKYETANFCSFNEINDFNLQKGVAICRYETYVDCEPRKLSQHKDRALKEDTDGVTTTQARPFFLSSKIQTAQKTAL